MFAVGQPGKTPGLLSEDVKKEGGLPWGWLAFQVRSEPATSEDRQGGHGAAAECQVGRELGGESERPVPSPWRSQWWKDRATLGSSQTDWSLKASLA